MTTTATIDQLRPGSEYPGGNINSRKTYTDQQVKNRLESILMFGVLQSLAVCPAPGAADAPYFVAAGGLRRAAVALGVKTKKLPADFPIPILVKPEWDSAMALAASLEENDQVLAPHPVNVFEQFSELAQRGKTAEEIGKLFRMETKEVRGVMALGRLSPKIRQAWIDEGIDANSAKAFTLASSHKHQDDVFAKLRKQGKWNLKQPGTIRRALVGGEQDVDKMMKFVEPAAYKAAGGELVEDLFGDNHAPKDVALLKRLADEKLDAKATELKAAGWAWVNIGGTAHFSWNSVPGGANAKKEDRAKAGVVIEIGHDGQLDAMYGRIRPGTKGAKTGEAAAGKPKEKAPPPTTLSNALRQDLTAMAARATKDALAADTYGNELATVLARIVAAQITPERYNYMPSEVREKMAGIRNGISHKVMAEALQMRFDRQRYFANAPKNLVLRAITEGVGAEHAKKYAGGTKSAAWKFALANVPKTWLPPELRTSHYDGPGAGKVVKLPAKKAVKAVAKKKAA